MMSQNFRKKYHPYFFLGGILIDESGCHQLEKTITQIQYNFFEKHTLGHDTELHGAEVFDGKKNFKGRKIPDRVQLFKDILSALARNSITVRVVRVHVPNHRKKYTPTAQPTAWSSDNLCGKELWEDITSDGTCSSSVDDCLMRDSVSGLTWSEAYPVSGAASSQTRATWNEAIDLCNDLDFGGITDWRLPTPMELQQANIHGIRQVGSKITGPIPDSKDNNRNFIANVDNQFWSAASSSSSQTQAWVVNLNTSQSASTLKNNDHHVICVRP